MTSTELSHTDTVPTLRIDGSLPLSADTIAVLGAFVDQIEDSGSAVAVLHLSGAPTVAADQGQHDVQLVSKWERAVRRLERVRAATVAVVTGGCGGVAFELLLSADRRLATADARLFVPSGTTAAWPGMGLYRLANQVGPARIRRTVLFGEPLTAIGAAEIGLIDQIVGADAGARAREVAATITVLGTGAGTELAIRRQLMLDATTTSFEDALGKHLAACDRVLRAAAVDRAAVRWVAR